jgi:type I restriction enzyme M protein
LYKERIAGHIHNYIEIENIGYDATGKKIGGSELVEIANRIQRFIIEEGL